MTVLKNNFRIILGIALCFATTSLFADNSNSDNNMPDREELEAAMQACAASLDSDGNGRPEPTAMEECMTAKGFTKPSGERGPGSNGMHHAPPSRM